MVKVRSLVILAAAVLILCSYWGTQSAKAQFVLKQDTHSSSPDIRNSSVLMPDTRNSSVLMPDTRNSSELQDEGYGNTDEEYYNSADDLVNEDEISYSKDNSLADD